MEMITLFAFEAGYFGPGSNYIRYESIYIH